MKTFGKLNAAIAGAALVAATLVTVVPTPASAIGVFVGPRGGVGVRLGGPRLGIGPRRFVRPGFGYRRGFGFRRGFGYRPGLRRGFRRF